MDKVYLNDLADKFQLKSFSFASAANETTYEGQVGLTSVLTMSFMDSFELMLA